MVTPSNVLICGKIGLATSALSRLGSVANITWHNMTTKDEFLRACDKSKPLAIYRPLDTLATIGRFDRSLLEQLPRSVKYIAHNGAGYDQIDVDAARRLRIRVSHTPQVVNNATADTAMFLIIGALPTGDDLGRDLQDKTVGIIGMGGIGSALARRCLAFDMKVQYHNRKELNDNDARGIPYVADLEQLLRTSDVVSLNLPLNSKTKHFMSAKQINMMKDGAVLVNTARGPILDERALICALESGKLGGAGLDVFEDEPAIDARLLRSDKVILLPHIGTVSYETQRALEELAIENIISACSTGDLKTPVSEHYGW